MRKLIIRSDADFPLPVHDGNPAIWHLAKVLAWFEEKKRYPIDETLLDVARISVQCNLLKEMGDIDPDIPQRLRAMMA